MSPPVARLLLVELAAIDRFHRAVLFPFCLGYARSAGIQARWLRFGVRADARHASASGGLDLGADQLAELDAATRQLRPDTVLFDRPPGPATLEALRKSIDGARVAVLTGQAARLEPGVEALDLLTGGFDTFLGRDDPDVRGPGLLEIGRPDHGYQAGDEAAAAMPALPFVFMGHECTYDRSFATNPWFDGLDLGGCLRSGGCAFCTRAAHGRDFHTAPLELLDRQLAALEQTLPARAGGLQVRLVGEPAVEHVVEVCRRARDLSARPLELLFDSRADRFERRAEDMQHALRELSGTGCRLQMSLLGIESFCSAALQRFNKGLDPATNIRAIQRLFELERDHPDTFGFREHGGLSLIPMSPWTRPTELALELAVARMLGIEALSGKLLTGRLRLHEGLPLTEAARRDGLLVQAYADPLLDTAGLNLYQPEIPWRFQQPAMEGICRLLVRLGASTPRGKPDALAAEVSKLGDASARTALRLIDCAMQADWEGESLQPQDLVRRAAAGRTAPEPAAFEHWTRYQDLTDGRSGLCEPEALLQVKPVCKLEPVQTADRERIEADPTFPNARSRRRSGDQEVWEVFYGRSEQQVQAALDTAATIERAGQGPAFLDAVANMGELLGYPDCCVQAFAGGRRWVVDNSFWLHVDRRLDADGPVPPELNPVANPLLEYIPCGLHCAESLERARRLRAASPILAGAAGQELIERLEHPALLFWSRQDLAVELVPEQEPGERFRYRAGLCLGSSPLTEAIAKGDELVLEAECTTVLAAGRELASLSGRAFLWWHRQVFQRDLWTALRDFVAAVGEPSQAPARREPPPQPGLAGRLSRMQARRIRIGQARLNRVTEMGADRVEVTLEGAAGRLVVEIGPRVGPAEGQLDAGPYRLSVPAGQAMAGPHQRAALRALAAALLRGEGAR